MNLSLIKRSFLIVTLDSCRWDSYQKAITPNLDSFAEFRKAGSQATFTYSSHLAMYMGIFPNCDDLNISYYNRYTKQLFRIDERPTDNKPLVHFPKGTKNIIEGFNKLGYNTFGTGAVAWFKHPDLVSPFRNFLYTGTYLDAQLAFLKRKISEDLTAPFFALLNIGETHEPYAFGGKVPPLNITRKRMLTKDRYEFLDDQWNMQVDAMSYVDRTLAPFLEQIENSERNVTVIVCADHGECFGEDGMHGHGFYHPKVMEVPLGIFTL